MLPYRIWVGKMMPRRGGCRLKLGLENRKRECKREEIASVTFFFKTAFPLATLLKMQLTERKKSLVETVRVQSGNDWWKQCPEWQ